MIFEINPTEAGKHELGSTRLAESGCFTARITEAKFTKSIGSQWSGLVLKFETEAGNFHSTMAITKVNGDPDYRANMLKALANLLKTPDSDNWKGLEIGVFVNRTEREDKTGEYNIQVEYNINGFYLPSKNNKTLHEIINGKEAKRFAYYTERYKKLNEEAAANAGSGNMNKTASEIEQKQNFHQNIGNENTGIVGGAIDESTDVFPF